MTTGTEPVGYHVRVDVECCANCVFGGYLGELGDPARMCVCEIFGEPSDGCYGAIAREPLGKCDAYKGRHEVRFLEDAHGGRHEVRPANQ